MLDHMDLRALRLFVTVVEAGSLTAAAGQLHLSQPALSIAIGRLEADLGVRLLERTPRGVVPTSAGRTLLDEAARLLDGVDAVTQRLRSIGDGRIGSISIAAVPVLMWQFVPELLREHATTVPGVEVTLVDPPPWQAIELLQQRSVDLAAIVVADAERFVERHAREFEIVEWGDVPLVAVLPPETDAPHAIGADWLADQAFVVPRRTAAVPSVPEAIDALFIDARVVPARLRTVETIQTILPLIEAGVAASILPDPGRRSLARFNVTVREVRPAPEPLRALVLVRRQAEHSAVVRGMLEAIRRHGAAARLWNDGTVGVP